MNIDKMQKEVRKLDRERRMLNLRVMTLGIVDPTCMIITIIMVESNALRAAIIAPLIVGWIVAMRIAMKKITKITERIKEYEAIIMKHMSPEFL